VLIRALRMLLREARALIRARADCCHSDNISRKTKYWWRPSAKP